MDAPFGVLALQGDFAAHAAAFRHLGVPVREVRRVAEIEPRIRAHRMIEEFMLAANEALIHRFHGHARTLMISRTRKHRPALRNRINLAFGVS